MKVTLGIVVTIVALFVGIFMISEVSSVIPDSQLYDYVYSTVTNNTKLTLNNSVNQTHSLSIGSIASIDGKTPEKILTIKVNNTATSNIYSLKIYLNAQLIATENLPNNTVSTFSYENVNIVENAVNNVTMNSNTTSADVDVLSSSIKYPSDKITTSFGDIHTGLVTNTGTIYNILVLVLIIIGLAVAIAYLNRFGGESKTTPAV